MMLARLMQRETRKAERSAVSLAARLRPSARESAMVMVENISPHGLRAAGSVAVKRGDWVSIEIPDVGPVTARIAWTRGNRFGLMFRNRVDLSGLVARRFGTAGKGARIAGTVRNGAGLPARPGRSTILPR